jgi:hypothetical protein
MAAVGTPGELQVLQAALQEVYELVIKPNQTTEQVNAGDLNYKQVRELVLAVQTTMKGDGTPTRPGIEQMMIQVNNLTQALTDTQARLAQVEKTVEPVLQQADVELKNLQAQSEEIKQVVGRELKTQEVKQAELIKHTSDKFKELEIKQSELIGNAKSKFDDMESAQQAILTGATTRFDELEQFRVTFEQQVATKIAETDTQMRTVSQVYDSLVALNQADVREVRATLAERLGQNSNGFGGNNNRVKEISEYKAVSALVRFSGDSRSGYKAWTIKLKNALDQVRGKEWRHALDAMERHRVSEDFEELASHDDQWNDWFENKFGVNRSDGGNVVDLEQFKSELMWLLTDKLDDNTVQLIQKQAPNGMRSYKKLWTWSQDISSQAKQVNMMSIMNPARATSDETLADRIESWDQEQIELLKVDPTCELRPPFILTSFKNLLPEKVLKHVEEQMDSTLSENYTKLRSKVYGWALKKRVEAKDRKSKGNVDNVNQDIPSNLPDSHTPHSHNHDSCDNDNNWGGGQDSGWYDDWGNWVDSMGTGKAGFKGGKNGKGPKGKGRFNGNCNRCGKPGHKAVDCRVNLDGKGKGGKGKGGYGWKGKGKGGFNSVDPYWNPSWNYDQPAGDNSMNEVGKGGFNGYCYNCNEWGHSARNCPQPPNPNKGKGGKQGVNNVDQHNGKGPGPQQQQQPQQPPQQQPPPQNKAPGFYALDFGGATEANEEQQQVRPLNKVFEQAGWRIAGKRGKSVMPNVSTILDLMMVDKTSAPTRVRWADVVSPPVPEPVPENWREIKITVDSGACDHVISPELVNTNNVRITDAVRNGVTYRTASGHILPNLGETNVGGVTGTGQTINMTMQVAGVNKALASVRKMCKSGNRVVFEDGVDDTIGGYVQNIVSGERTPITKEGGTYQVSVWTQEDGGSCPRLGQPSYFDALTGVDEDDAEEPADSGTAQASTFMRPAQ